MSAISSRDGRVACPRPSCPQDGASCPCAVPHPTLSSPHSMPNNIRPRLFGNTMTKKLTSFAASLTDDKQTGQQPVALSSKSAVKAPPEALEALFSSKSNPTRLPGSASASREKPPESSLERGQRGRPQAVWLLSTITYVL
ncbi:hypothetical protein JB92DRAFT_1515161 [Gautieria morchelliformis]|nr:hypothetical protein JB92DRAFT_1515161 [Gautieria morchelliformis]